MNPMQSPNTGVGRSLSREGSRFRDIELEAEMFRVIRANRTKSAKFVIKKIRDQIPEITNQQIADFMEELKLKY